MNNVIEKLAAVMEEDEFYFEQHPNAGAISFQTPGSVGMLDVSVFVNDEIDVVHWFEGVRRT